MFSYECVHCESIVLLLNGSSCAFQVVEFDLAMQREDAVDFVPVRIDTDSNAASLEVLALYFQRR